MRNGPGYLHQMFELLGAFILSQTSYNGYDFRTHKRAEAILYIGTIGGIAMGLILIVFDTILGTRRAFADVEPGTLVYDFFFELSRKAHAYLAKHS